MKSFLLALHIAVLTAGSVHTARASDHADPIDLFNRKPLEAGITDLFFFPDRNIRQYVVILCVRRALTNGDLDLEPYTYEVYMDLRSRIDHSDEQTRFRYGGRVVQPRGISEDVTLSFRLDDTATIVGTPTVLGLGNVRDRIAVWVGKVGAAKPRDEIGARIGPRPGSINVWAGIADDPFIFPSFFGTNVVAIVTTIPFDLFEGQQDWILWASSIRDGKRIDHVGRSLRTQNPRFELLNTLHPRDHVDAVHEEHEHPSLMRDVFLRLGFTSLFGYRTWDQVPDVMLYTNRPFLHPNGVTIAGAARFPNGRALQDDVAEDLARYGDTLLKEISHIAGGWPRATKNDMAFRPTFPYLADPWPDSSPRTPPTLTTASKIKLAAIGLLVVGLWVATAWLLAAALRYLRKA